VLELVQVRVSTATRRQTLLLPIERLCHGTALRITSLALDEQVGRLEGGADFIELQLPRTARRTSMGEISPREIIDMPLGASDDEAGGNDGRGITLVAVRVNPSRAVRSIGVLHLEGEKAGLERCKSVAQGAPEPLRERRNWHTDPGFLSE